MQFNKKLVAAEERSCGVFFCVNVLIDSKTMDVFVSEKYIFGLSEFYVNEFFLGEIHTLSNFNFEWSIWNCIRVRNIYLLNETNEKIINSQRTTKSDSSPKCRNYRKYVTIS